jgi:ATP-dependent DNA ligase
MRGVPGGVARFAVGSLSFREIAHETGHSAHLDNEEGPLVFLHACKMGLESIVSKRRDSHYRSGRSPDWIKSKNPAAPAVRREAEEDWTR